MTDITMCKNKECSKKNSCYCYITELSIYSQSYFVDNPQHYGDDGCLYYWEVCGI